MNTLKKQFVKSNLRDFKKKGHNDLKTVAIKKEA